MASTRAAQRRLRLTVARTRAVDRYAIEELGIPGPVLMENAGRNAADLIARWLPKRTAKPLSPSRVTVICGRGNNGGDGFVIARHLTNRGCRVQVDLVADPSGLSGDAAVNHGIAERMGVPIRVLGDRRALSAAARRWRQCEVVVDALLGTGFRGPVREPMAVRWSRSSGNRSSRLFRSVLYSAARSARGSNR